MNRHKRSFNDIPVDVADLRSTNWERFANSILYNLHNQLLILLDNDSSKEEEKKDAYKEYTCKLGNDGTITELILMAEMFGFVCCVIDESNFNCYDPCVGVSI